MRTSGADSDTALFILPVAVVIVLSVIWMGGPRASLRIIDASVLNGLHWLRGHLP